MPATVLNAKELWKKNELTRWIIFFSIAIVFTFIDLISKSLTFEINTKSIIPNILQFKSVINRGIIWGLFSQGSPLFIIIPCLAIPLIVLMFRYIHMFVYHNPYPKNDGQPSGPADAGIPSPDKTLETAEISATKFSIFSTIGMLTIACGLILAGAAGNLYDRILYRGVRDFIDFYVINWPIFNLADAYITVGAFLIIICMFKRPHPVKTKAIDNIHDA
jgi:lipoprotein signal peptidase